MPSPVASLMAAVGLEAAGSVPWGTTIPLSQPGVYVVALAAGDETGSPTLARCPTSRAALEELLAARPELKVDGARPTVRSWRDG